MKKISTNRNISMHVTKKSKLAMSLALVVTFMVACSNGANNKFKLEGKKSGKPLALYEQNLPVVPFDPGVYSDLSGVEFPVDDNGILTLPYQMNPFNLMKKQYKELKNPALFLPQLTRNAGLSKVKTYNIGGFEYHAWIRLTDDTRTVIPDTDALNKPQGAILTAIWVDSNQNPVGSLMVMNFRHQGFPKTAKSDTVRLPVNLDENLFLVLNYHEEDSKNAYLIGTATVGELVANNDTFKADKELTKVPKFLEDASDREKLLYANGFHRVTLQVGDDASVDLATKANPKEKFRAPTIRVLVDGEERIVYKNMGSDYKGEGASHALGGKNGAWDTPTKVLGDDQSIGVSVLEVASKGDSGHIFSQERSANAYQNLWRNIVEKANMVTFGLAMRLGVTGLDKKNATTGKVISTASKNDHLSPQLGQIGLIPYKEPVQKLKGMGIKGGGTVKIFQGKSQALVPKFTPWGASNQNVTWSKVSGSGKISINAETGVVSVASTATRGEKATFKVTAKEGGLSATTVVSVASTLDKYKTTQPFLGLDKGYYTDLNNAMFPVEEHGLLTLPKVSGNYDDSGNPVLFLPQLTPNMESLSESPPKVDTYNIGGYTYSAWVRHTDNTKTELLGGSLGSIPHAENKPQGAILTAIWLDANQNPVGSFMVMTFIDGAFPHIKVLAPFGADTNPELDENVFLVLNYHGASNAAYLIGLAKVPALTANNNPFDPNASISGSPSFAVTPKEKLLYANGFHKVSLVLDEDANANAGGHGPTVRVLVDGQEVIVYNNTGGSHSLTKGVWDTTKTIGFPAEKHFIGKDVLEIANSPTSNHIFASNRGAPDYNTQWGILVSKASMVTFGVAMKLAATGPEGSYVTRNTLSPQVGGVSLMPKP